MSAPLLLVPGAFCGAWAFDALAPALAAAGREVRALDLPGHAPGAPPPIWTSLGDYAAAVAEAARRCARPPLLVGHSMGGLVAQLVAARTPVAGLVLLAPSPAWGQAVTTSAELVGGPALLAARGPYWLQAIEPDWGVVREHTLDRLPEARAREIYARMVPESGRALFEVLSWWADAAMAAAVPSLDLPSLTLTGGLDRVHPPATTQATASRLRGEHRILPGVSHWTLDGPGTEDLPAGILAFADRLPSA